MTRTLLTALYAGLCVVTSIWFISEGYSGPDEIVPTQTVLSSRWINVSGGSLEHFVCPDTGEIIADVWENGTWSAHAYSRTSWDRLEANYSDRSHAEKAVEEFVHHYNICKH